MLFQSLLVLLGQIVFGHPHLYTFHRKISQEWLQNQEKQLERHDEDASSPVPLIEDVVEDIEHDGLREDNTSVEVEEHSLLETAFSYILDWVDVHYIIFVDMILEREEKHAKRGDEGSDLAEEQNNQEYDLVKGDI